MDQISQMNSAFIESFPGTNDMDMVGSVSEPLISSNQDILWTFMIINHLNIYVNVRP